AADSRERANARLRVAEALRDPGDGAAVVALVEEVGRLDDGELRLGQPPQDRLVGDRRLGDGALARLEQARERELPPRAVGRDRRRRRAALLQPAGLDREVLAERADVDVVLAVGRKSRRPLAHQQRPFANRAGTRDGLSRDPHRADYTVASSFSCLASAITFWAMCEGTSS